MTNHSHLTKCPVCDYDLGYMAWDGDVASFEICPSCGIQFGYTDAAGGSKENRIFLYKNWQETWLKNQKQPLSKDQEAEVIRLSLNATSSS